ncbi:unnamed protein product [Echinostoma caproni]|uniref:PACT_coil_coil domain-containing protein n=1 Tax=Echinostoma caproni TaxID=27848 RepID=A0A183A7U6_9TREM|nr:unnamed protein product [Echinostoma caproni]
MYAEIVVFCPKSSHLLRIARHFRFLPFQDRPDDNIHLVAQLREQLSNMKTDLVNQKAETAAMQARQQHLENLVRDLRRDNVDLRDQLAKLDDAENSLAESDKPLAAGTRMLQIQLEQQNERVRELQLKLNASRDYTEQLEARIAQFEQSSAINPGSNILPIMSSPGPIMVQVSQSDDPPNEVPGNTADSTMPTVTQLLLQTFRPATCLVSLNGMGALDLQGTMYDAMERDMPGFRAPRVDDKLLQDTIRTFQALLSERDQELAQLKQHIRQHADDLSMHEQCKVILPQLFESAVQTDLTMEQAQRLASVTNTLAEGGLLLTYDQSHALLNEVYQCVDALGSDDDESAKTDRPTRDQLLGFTDLLTATNRLRARVQQCPNSGAMVNGEVRNLVKIEMNEASLSPPPAPGNAVTECVFWSKSFRRGWDQGVYTEVRRPKSHMNSDSADRSQPNQGEKSTAEGKKGLELTQPDSSSDTSKLNVTKSETSEPPKPVTDDSFKEVIAETIRILKGEKKKQPKVKPEPISERFFDVGLQVGSDLEMEAEDGVSRSTVDREAVSPVRRAFNKWYRFTRKARKNREKELGRLGVTKVGTTDPRRRTYVLPDAQPAIIEETTTAVDGSLQKDHPDSQVDTHEEKDLPATESVSKTPGVLSKEGSRAGSVRQQSVSEPAKMDRADSFDTEKSRSPSKKKQSVSDSYSRSSVQGIRFGPGGYSSQQIDKSDVRAAEFFHKLILAPHPSLTPFRAGQTKCHPDIFLSGLDLVLTDPAELETFQFMDDLAQEAFAFYVLMYPFTRHVCYFISGKHCLAHSLIARDCGQSTFFEEMYTACGRPKLLRSHIEKLVSSTVQSLAKRVPKTDLNTEAVCGADQTDLACILGHFLYSNYHYWRETVTAQTNGATAVRNKSEKRRWLEDALLCLTLSGVSTVLSDAIPADTHEWKSGDSKANLAETINTLLTHWRSQSPSWLIEKLRTALIELPRPSLNWYVAVIDLSHVPREVLSRILGRLCMLSLGHGVLGHGSNTTRSVDTDRLYVNHIHGILLLRMRLTARILYPIKSAAQAGDLSSMKRAVDELGPPCPQYHLNELITTTGLGPYAPLAADLHDPKVQPTSKLWLPKHKFIPSTDPSLFVLSRLFICKAMDLIRTYTPVNTKASTNAALRFARSLKIALPNNTPQRLSLRWLLRQLEAHRDLMYGTRDVAGQLMHIWCQTSTDWNQDTLSLQTTRRTFVANVWRPLEQTVLRFAGYCERDLAFTEPSFMFVLVALADREQLYANRIKSLLCTQFWPSPAAAYAPLWQTGKRRLTRSQSAALNQGQMEDQLLAEKQRGEGYVPSDVDRSPERSNSRRMTTSMIDTHSGRKPHSPEHYNGQLDELRQTGDLESVRAHLGVSERRRQELEHRLLEITEELSRARAEARSADTSLAAARRTEAALRRRLLVAMDMQGSCTDPSSVRHSYSGTLSAGTEARDALELQAALIKAEATNAALTEAAQLDRSRLHEQAMRIGQFEAEHRALLDRISILQTTEANAQRGIVRLQALYEDMLREYSESRSQELNWRSRERSRSNYRQQQNDSKSSKPPTAARTDPNVSKLQRQIQDLEAENRALKHTINSQNSPVTAVVSQPVGPCNSPACIEVRHLLKAFQERFSEAVGQAEKCLDTPHMEDGSETSGTVRNVLVTSLRNKLTSLQQLLRHAESGLDPATFATEIATCNQLVARLEGWLNRYMHRTDGELSELRSRLVELQISAFASEAPTFVTSCTERENGHPFSCSISLNKKPNTELLAQREQEIMKLRKQLREIESELELRKTHSCESQPLLARAAEIRTAVWLFVP